jgi:hypothetical protein
MVCARAIGVLVHPGRPLLLTLGSRVCAYINLDTNAMAKKVKRGRGRPATGHIHTVTARLTDAAWKGVRKFAAEHGVNRSEALRRLVDLGLGMTERGGKDKKTD